jgi:hypothetical protein
VTAAAPRTRASWLPGYCPSLPALIVALAAVLAPCGALCAPPEGADPNGPLAEWYCALKTPEGGSCCSVADCRPVQARQMPDGWQILIPFEGSRDQCVSVPPDRVLKLDNEDGRPIACVNAGIVLCFIPPSGA